MYKLYQKESLCIFVGTVDGAPERREREGVVAMVVTLKDYAGKRIKIYFRNGEKNKLADRIVNAKVSDGSFMAVQAICTDPEEKTATGQNFKFHGVWELNTGSDTPPVTILLGKAYQAQYFKATEGKPEQFRFGVRVVEKDRDPFFVNVTFRNNDKRKDADFVQRVFYGTDKPFVAVVGGSIKTYDNGSKYVTGWRVTKKPEEPKTK